MNDATAAPLRATDKRWLDIDQLISERSRAMKPSGIRRIFEIAAKLKDPIDLSIGQPDFPVPEAIKRAAVEAIGADHNGYTLTQGIPHLRARIARHLAHDLGWPSDIGSPESDAGLMVTTGTSGALYIAMMALLSPGDEIVIPDPYFVAYPHMATLTGGVAVPCQTYPDFHLTAERVEPLITKRTKAVLLNSPGNPSGVVMSGAQCAELRDLCARKGVLLISDEIYDEFTFDAAREDCGTSGRRCPSPCRSEGAWETVLLIRGFGKTYGCTGWRMGYAAGPKGLINEMSKMQQFSFVCAPAPFQHACAAALDVDMSETVALFNRRRDRVLEKLSPLTNITTPGGAFYVFFEVPRHLNMTGSQFCERALQENVVMIPGGVFSGRDTHVRLSYAVADEKLEQGLDVLTRLLRGATA